MATIHGDDEGGRSVATPGGVSGSHPSTRPHSASAHPESASTRRPDSATLGQQSQWGSGLLECMRTGPLWVVLVGLVPVMAEFLVAHDLGLTAVSVAFLVVYACTSVVALVKLALYVLAIWFTDLFFVVLSFVLTGAASAFTLTRLLLHWHTRGRFRAHHRIRGSRLHDALAVTFCYFCSLCQMWREAAYRSRQPPPAAASACSPPEKEVVHGHTR